MRKQISLPVALASSKQDSNGERDVDPLLKISQPNGNVEVKKKILSKTSKSLDIMSLNKMKKQVSLPVPLAPSEPDVNGVKDVDPLLNIPNLSRNVEVKKKMLSKTSTSLDYEQPIHPIPSSQITLNEEEKLELEYVLFLETLDSIGLR